MFRIGDFSKLTCVSIKMLRHYAERGLLPPASVDRASGYRYYTADQLPRLNRLLALRDLGFSLDQIGGLLDQPLSSAELRGMLKLRRAEILSQVRLEQQRLARVEARLYLLDQDTTAARYDVVVRTVAPQLMATLRQTVPSLGEPIAELFDTLEAYAARHRVRAPSSPLTIFHDSAYRETDLDVEVAIPLLDEAPPCPPVILRNVPGDTMACIVYTGSYERTADVLQALLVWVAAHGYAINGALREVYLRFGADNGEQLGLPSAFLADDPPLYVTEVQLPVQRREDHALPTVGAERATSVGVVSGHDDLWGRLGLGRG
ncbi:MerR family transcriptional regulator [Candidatus Gracilibacteria bacterium]|nr:MerR family transcriptional regulator [Candidatus Gracilibacteria bacterium]